MQGKAISAYGVIDAKPVNGRWAGRLFDIQNLGVDYGTTTAISGQVRFER